MLRLFSPGNEHAISASSSLKEFFEDWYVPNITNNKRRRPISDATINRRRAAVNWWARLMGSKHHPAGPPIGDINEELLIQFQEKLTAAKYRRGKYSAIEHPLSRITQIRTMEEVQIVLATAGPASGRRVRAGLLAESPAVYTPPPDCFPKGSWPLDDARKIVAAIAQSHPPKNGVRFPTNLYMTDQTSVFRVLAEATLALWFYTGHRATTYQRLTWSSLIEDAPGQWYLGIDSSVKTGKRDRIAVHPALLSRILKLRGLDPVRMFPWPVRYSAIVDAHTRLQTIAELPPQLRFSPQAWRRLHSKEIARVGYSLASSLASGSLGHSSASITEAHYTSARDAAVLMLPDLFDS
jgi:integrase